MRGFAIHPVALSAGLRSHAIPLPQAKQPIWTRTRLSTRDRERRGSEPPCNRALLSFVVAMHSRHRFLPNLLRSSYIRLPITER